jgi:hypothetical protein
MIKYVALLPLRVNTDDRGYLTVIASTGREEVPDVPVIRVVYLVGDTAKGVMVVTQISLRGLGTGTSNHC